jgi:hypothetical protein
MEFPMHHLIRSLVVLVAMLNAPLALGEEAKLPTKAQEVMDKLEKSEGKLTSEYKKSLTTERNKSIVELQKAQKDTTKAGDLEGALAIKKQIEELQAKIAEDDDTDLLGSKAKVDLGKMFVGMWNWNKSNGMAGSMEAFADGRVVARVTSPREIPFVAGNWELKEDKITLTWRHDPTKPETLSFTGPTKITGDHPDLGKRSFNATKQPSE